jgi:hypothetical protein
MAAAAKPLLVTEATNRGIGAVFDVKSQDRLKGAYSDLWSSLEALRRHGYLERTRPGSAWRYRLTSLGKQAAAALAAATAVLTATTEKRPDFFETREQREAVYQRACQDNGSGKAVAAVCGVHYTDLRRWVRERDLGTKVDSKRRARIEEALLPYVSSM